MKKMIINHPFENTWSGPGFPIGEGPFVRISKHAFLQYLEIEEARSKLWISTSKCYNFHCISNSTMTRKSAEKHLSNFRYYNCTKETGETIAFWADIGDLTVSRFQSFCNTYYNTEIKSSDLLEMYCEWAQ